MRVYKNEKGWSEFIKNEYNGEKSKCYLPVTFAKNCGEPNVNEQGYVDIDVQRFFHTCYADKNQVNQDGSFVGKPKTLITQWDYVVVTKKEDVVPNFKAVTDEELPF